MPAEASQEERILLYRLDGEVVNSSYMANALDELGKLAERDSSPVATISDYRCERAVAYRVWTEYNLGQRR
jgi:hypothetical protein